MECLAVMWGSVCSPEPEGSWRRHVLLVWCYLFHKKTTNFCPAVYTSSNTNVPSWNFWKPKQCMAHLLLCEQRSGYWYIWVPLSLEQPLPLWTFQFIPLSFPQSQHMLNSQHSNVPWLWEGHQKAGVWPRAAGLSPPGFTISPDLCKSKRAFGAWSANTIG